MKIIKTATLTILMAVTAIPAWGMDMNGLLSLLPLAATTYLLSATPSSNYQIPRGEFWCKRIWNDDNITRAELSFKPTSLSNACITKVDIRHLLVIDDAQDSGVDAKLLEKFEEEIAAQCPKQFCSIKTTPRNIALFRQNNYTCKNSTCTKKIASTMEELKVNQPHNESLI